VKLALLWAQPGRQVAWSAEALAPWAELYRELGASAIEGASATITARADAQILRIALLYALLDQNTEIGISHLNAAREVWRYCSESALYIFGESSGDKTGNVILEALRSQPDGMTQTDISRLFRGHKTSNQLQRALESLREQALISSLGLRD
jgi:hypothetical protein